MTRWCVMLCLVVAVATPVSCSTLSVPAAYATIQEAVDAAQSGDTILISPGDYYETISILDREHLTIRGDPSTEIDSTLPCWDAISRPALEIIIHGSIQILASRDITLEMVSVTGRSVGVLIAGTPSAAAHNISIRYCNLLCNQEEAVKLLGTYHHVALTCSNACMSNGDNSILGASDILPHQEDLYVSCTLTYSEDDTRPLPSLQSREIVVAVIDSGIDQSIPDLRCRLWTNPQEIPGNGVDDDLNGYVDDIHGWDFRDDDAETMVGTPFHWHGTFVAGVLADSLESSAVASADPWSVKIMDLRFLDSQSLFYATDWPKLVRALEYAMDNGARVINLSIYATSEPPDAVRNAIKEATRRGIVVVGAAGNDAGPLGPIASWEEVLTVGALDREGGLATFSNTGDQVDIEALGVDVLSLLPGGVLAFRSGTSFAAPLVAGVAALHLSASPDLLPQEVEMLLKERDSD